MVVCDKCDVAALLTVHVPTRIFEDNPQYYLFSSFPSTSMCLNIQNSAFTKLSAR